MIAVSSLPPPEGIDELLAALDAHRAGARPVRRGGCARAAPARSPTSRSSTASTGLRALGGREAAPALLAEQPAGADSAALLAALRERAGMPERGSARAERAASVTGRWRATS